MKWLTFGAYFTFQLFQAASEVHLIAAIHMFDYDLKMEKIDRKTWQELWKAGRAAQPPISGVTGKPNH